MESRMEQAADDALMGDWEHVFLERKRLNGYDVMGVSPSPPTSISMQDYWNIMYRK